MAYCSTDRGVAAGAIQIKIWFNREHGSEWSLMRSPTHYAGGEGKMAKPDYVVHLTGEMPDGTRVDKKFETVEAASALVRKMRIVDLAYLKPIYIPKIG